jgi:transcriptional regulator GlxA family with amidase domain
MSFMHLNQHAQTADTFAHIAGATAPADDEARCDSRTRLVERAVSLLRDSISEPVTMAELSRKAGVSERTLRAAFHDVLGLSPKQYALAQRLRAAHDALCVADPGSTTVTDIATAYGFFELGRFAGRYRHTFGEVPSQTLHHAVGSWAGEAA